jgi:hypothetical protein
MTPAWYRRRFGVLVLGLMIGGMGAAIGAKRYQSVVTPLGQRSLESGALFSTLALKHDTSVVLLYRPADCFSCFGVLADWLRWQAESGVAVTIVLTDAPRTAELMQLRLFGVAAYEVLDGPVPVGFPLPATVLYRQGKLEAVSSVRPGEDFLLTVLQATTVAGQAAKATATRVVASRP